MNIYLLVVICDSLTVITVGRILCFYQSARTKYMCLHFPFSSLKICFTLLYMQPSTPSYKIFQKSGHHSAQNEMLLLTAAGADLM